MAVGDLGYQVISQTKFTRGEAGTVNTLPGYDTHQNLIQSIPLPDTGKGDTRSSNILIVSEDTSGLPAAPDLFSFVSDAVGTLHWNWTPSVVPPGGRPVTQQVSQYRINSPQGPWTESFTFNNNFADEDIFPFAVSGETYDGRVIATNANGTTSSNEVLGVTVL